MLQLLYGFGFDLPDTFTGDGKDASDFFERIAIAVGQPKPHAEDFALAAIQRLEGFVDALAKHLLIDVPERVDATVIFEKLAEITLVVITDRLVERKWLSCDFHNASHIFQWQISGVRQFFECWFAAVNLHEIACHGANFRHRIHHVDRNSNRTALVGDRARDRLTNPPGRVRREFVAAAVLEFLHSTHQTCVAFLNEIQKAEPPISIALRDRYD